MADMLTGRAFDCITVNWVLHHLVGKSYRTCWQNCLATLVCCKGLLKPNGGAWQQLFAQAGFEVVAFQRGRGWWRGSFRVYADPLLFLKSASNDHFFLKIADNREIYYTQGQEST